MIIEERNYTLHPGKVPEWIAAMNPDGIRIQQSVLGKLVGYFHTEVGPLNQIVHIWAYDSFEDRLARRAKLGSAAGWDDVRKKILPLIHEQWNRILMPAPFSPVK
jgi:hypothetical protein